jgi:Domain of unknown function (DUF4214)
MATADFIIQVYTNVYGTPPSTLVLNQLVGQIDIGGVSSNVVAQQIIESAQGVAAQNIAKFYEVFLGRVPDLGGLKVQEAAIASGQLTMSQLAVNFANSAEFATRFPSTDPSAFIESLYTTVLGRPSDPGGKAVQVAYYNSLKAAGMSDGQAKAQLATNFAASAEYTTATSGYFKSIITYAAVDGALGTDKTPYQATSLLPSSQLIGFLNDGIVGNGIPGAGGGSGTIVFGNTITLTTGPDTITGTGGNDLIRAFVDDVTAANNTFAAVDSIDGGPGTDRLAITVNNVGGAVTLPGALVKNVEQVYVKAANTVAAVAGVETVTYGATTSAAGATATVTINGTTYTYTTLAANETANTIALGVKAAVDAANLAGVTTSVNGGVVTITFPGAVPATTAGGNAVGIAPAVAVTTAGTTAVTETVTFNGSSYTGLQEVWNDGNNAGMTFNVNNIAASTLIGLNAGTTNAETVSFTSAGTATVLNAGSGTGSSLTMAQPTTVNYSSSANSTLTTLNVGAATTLNFTGGGGNTTIGTLTTGATPTINVSGSNNVTVNSALTNGAKVIATGSGNTKFIDSAAADVTFTGGSGADTFVVNAAHNVTKIVDGGAGSADVIEFGTQASYANLAAFKNFEIAQFDATGTYDLSGLATQNAIGRVNVNADNVVVNNLQAGVGGSAAGTVTFAAGSTAVVNYAAATINVAGATGALQNNDTLALTNGSTKALTLTTLNVAGVEHLTFAIGGGLTIGAVNDAAKGIVDSSLQDVTFTGKGTLNYSSAALSSVVKVDATAITGTAGTDTVTLNATGAGAAQQLLGSKTLANTLTGGFNGDVLAGGAAADTIAVTGNANIITVGGSSATTVDKVNFTFTSNATQTTSGAGSAMSVITDYVKASSTVVTGGYTDIKITDLNGNAVTVIQANIASAVTTVNSVNYTTQVTNGVLTIGGTAPTSLATAIAIADAVVTTADRAVAFVYGGDTYIFEQNGTVGGNDFIVKLAGVSSINALNADGNNAGYVFLT